MTREHIVIDVGGRKLAVPTEHAREVAAAGWVTPVPLSRPPIAGVTQLRGQILPVLDVVEPPRAVQPEDPLLAHELDVRPCFAAIAPMYGPVNAEIP